MHGSHSHSQAAAPETQGLVLHHAGLYNKVFSGLLRASEGRILELARVKPGDTVLDAGCGPAGLSIRAKKEVGTAGKVYGIDAAPEMVEVARQNAAKARLQVDFQVGVIEAFPFPDNTFDVVVSRLVIHHLPGDLKRKGFAEMYRVLKPGGVCLAADFELSSLPLGGFYLKPFANKVGMIKVDTKNYIPLLEEAGFIEVEAGPTGRRMLSYVRGRKPGVKR